MALDVDTLVAAMTQAGEGLAGGIWNQIQTYAAPEFQKIAVQIVAIEQNIGDYTPDGAKALLDMQVRASIAVIVGMTSMTLLDVQSALNQILAAIKTLVNGALGFAMLA